MEDRAVYTTQSTAVEISPDRSVTFPGEVLVLSAEEMAGLGNQYWHLDAIERVLDQAGVPHFSPVGLGYTLMERVSYLAGWLSQYRRAEEMRQEYEQMRAAARYGCSGVPR